MIFPLVRTVHKYNRKIIEIKGKLKKCRTVRTVPKSNRKIVEIKGKIRNTTLSEQFLNLIEK
jgi:hypothetical protein